MTPLLTEPPAANTPDGRTRAQTEEIHGLTIRDDHRWLEEPSDARNDWISGHNTHTRRTLDQIPAVANFTRRLSQLVRVGTAGSPALRHDRLFILERSGNQERAVLGLHSASNPQPGPGVVLVDPAEITGDEQSAIDWYCPNFTGDLVAFGTSVGGDERSTLRILHVPSGNLLDEQIPHTTHASIAWLPDGTGFYYTRRPDPADVGEEEAEYHRGVWFHTLGADHRNDQPVMVEFESKEFWPDVSLSDDGRWLLIHASLGWDRTDIHIQDRHNDTWTTVVQGRTEATTWFEVDGDRLIGLTTLDAPRGRIVEVPLDDVCGEWVDVVGEGDDVCADFVITNEHLIVHRQRVGVSTIHLHDRQGRYLEQLELPEPVVEVTALVSDETNPGLVLIGYSSFTRKTAVLSWRPHTTPTDAVLGTQPDIADLTVEQVEYPSNDGAMVPMMLIRSADTTPGPDVPTLLYGYGGFAITLTPGWSSSYVAWCEAGGQVAIAGIRGGTEHGEAWHQAGTGKHKPQVFADFEAAADWLVETGRTSRHRLGMWGGSNGGLLVAACLTRRPDLVGAVLCEVPLTDMVRYARFLIGRLWIPEYGDPDDPEALAVLHGYSPYHQIRDGVAYPATLITTGESDTRVDPCHAYKFAARLNEATTGGPVLLRVQSSAGHGAAMTTSGTIAESADELGFLAWHLGLDSTGWTDTQDAS